MKTINTIEEAVVGRTINLSTVECLVVAELVSSLTIDINPRTKYTNVKTEEIMNMCAFLMKVTGQDIISVEEAKQELFAPVEEELRYNTDGDAITSTVEAYNPDRDSKLRGEHKVGRIPLDNDNDDINDIINAS